VNNLRTVSDTKKAFYTAHTRPINSIYRRVVEELMVEIHLLRVNEDFTYDAVFALGVVTTFERFMQGYQPEVEQTSIFKSLCIAEELAADQLKGDTTRLLEKVAGKSADDLLSWVVTGASSGGDEFQAQLRGIANNPKFKYSRLFAIGLFTLWETSQPDLIKDQTAFNTAFEQACAALKLPEGKPQKDLELYRSNLDKMAQARKTLADIVEAERKRRQQASAPQDTVPAESASTSEASS
jgi:photosystem II biogenesis protein Psp29